MKDLSSERENSGKSRKGKGGPSSLGCSGQSEKRIRFIFSARGSSHIIITVVILLHEKFLQFDWPRAVVFQLNLKYLYVKITKPLRVVV